MDRLWENLRKFWKLDERVAFLNHGSFGACPIPVLEYQAQLRDAMERNPVRFLVNEYPERLNAVRQQVAQFVNARSEDIAFVHNTTSGVNAVLRSLTFHSGDEILTTNHAYGACRSAIDYTCARTGAQVVVAAVPFPIADARQVVDAVLARASDRTRLAVIDHVTSITGLVFPIDQVVSALRRRGIETLVDGAHALGMLPVDLTALGASYYVGNFHKWICSPKGAAMLWVHPDRQSAIVPGTVSHGYSHDAQWRFQSMFDWQGTDDPTAWLSVGEAMRFMSTLFAGGWSTIQSRNHRVVMLARDALCEALEQPPPCPEQMVGSMVSFPISRRRVSSSDLARVRTLPSAAELYERLVAEGFETMVMPWPSANHRVIRVTAQVYNSPQDYERLAALLPRLLN
jgi:isopenicillin-N epimerase